MTRFASPSPNGTLVEGILNADRSYVCGSVMIAHTFGHGAYGAEKRVIDGVEIPPRKSVAGGITVNRLFPINPRIKEEWKNLYNSYAGTYARAGVPVEVAKVAARSA